MLLTEKDEGSAYYMVRNLTFPEMEDQDMQCRYHHWDSCQTKEDENINDPKHISSGSEFTGKTM